MTILTLARAVERIVAGEDPEGPLSEFVATFLQFESNEVRLSLIADAPSLTGEKRLDALVGAMGEYMAKQCRLARVPPWVGDRARYLELPWHVLLFNDGRERPVLSTDAGFREFLTFSSPAEFRSRNISTEACPLPPRFYRRAETALPSQ